MESICFLGFGEVAASLATSLTDNHPTIRFSAFDPKCKKDDYLQQQKDGWPSITFCQDVKPAVEQADLIVSAVTAEQNLLAAQSVSPFVSLNAWFLDLNSVSPNTKQDCAKLITEAGGRYVEAAIMSPIQPKGVQAPILLGGPQAKSFLSVIQALGFSGAEFYSEELGKAAACKMCRSVMIKGMESLLTESLLSARHYGVEDSVITSLENLMPGIDWHQHAAYMISRSLEHGVRRAEEMREVNRTVIDAGLPGKMSAACAETQAWTAQLNHDVNNKSLIRILDKSRENL